jgi:hypothetical protein
MINFPKALSIPWTVLVRGSYGDFGNERRIEFPVTGGRHRQWIFAVGDQHPEIPVTTKVRAICQRCKLRRSVPKKWVWMPTAT